MEKGQEGSAIEVRRRLEERARKIEQHRRDYTRRYYEGVTLAKSKGIPVCYATAITPFEICHAMNVMPCMPENYVAICCTKQMAEKFCEATEARGVSRDNCSYPRVGLGMMWLEDGPYGALPKPDFVIGNTFTCDAYSKWFEIYARYFQVPLFRLDGPFNLSGKPRRYEIEWMANQQRKLCTFIEEITGKKLDYDRLREVVKLADQACELYLEIQEYRKAIPCPRDFRETLGDAFYLIVQRGTPQAVEYFTMVRDNVKEMVENKIGILPQERLRLIWDNVPPWYRLSLLDYFGQRGAVFCTDTYPTAHWIGYHFDGGHLDPEDPFETMSEYQLYYFVLRGMEAQTKMLERMVKEWHCDGAVFFNNRNCLILSRAVPAREELFRERTGLPSMSFEAEMADPRSLDEIQVKAKIDAFLEMLEQRKAITK